MSKDLTSVRVTHRDTIKAMQSAQLKDATDGQIAKALSQVYFMVGLRPDHYPTAEEDLFIFSYLRKNYGHRRLEELVMAFDLAINGHLDTDEIKVYDQFSIEYMVRIMNSYGRYCTQLLTKMPEIVPVARQLAPAAINKQEEIEYWKAKKDLSISLLPEYLYQYLVDLGYISGEEDIKRNTRAAEYYYSELKKKAEGTDREHRERFAIYRNMYNKGILEGQSYRIVNSISKKMAVIDYFNSINV